MPRRGGNSLLQAMEELRVSPRAHQSVGRPMAGYERHSVSLIFWLTAGSRNFPSEQPFRSICDTSPLLLAIRPFQRCPRLSTANLPRGYDAGKKIKGRKRHALVDTDGRGLVLEPHPASIQDRDGGGALLKASRRIFPFIDRVFADGDMPASVLPPQPASSLRSSISILIRSASLFCRADGLLSVSSLGSGAIGDSQRTLRPQSPPPGHSSTPHPSCCFHVAWRGQYEFRNRLLASNETPSHSSPKFAEP